MRASRDGVEGAVGAVIFRVDPGARFGAVLVFQPAIGIGDRDSVKGVDGVGLARGRRARCARRLLSGGKRGAESREASEQQQSSLRKLANGFEW